MTQYDGTDKVQQTPQPISILSSLGVQMNRSQFEFVYKMIRQKFRSCHLPVPNRQDAKLLIAANPQAMKVLTGDKDIVDRAYEIANILATVNGAINWAQSQDQVS